jgi:hypothetical protein
VLNIKYFAAKKSKTRKRMSSVIQPVFFLSSRRLRQCPIESYVKIVLCLMIVSFYGGVNFLDTFHVIGFWAIIGSAFVEILMHHELVSLPPGSDYASICFYYMSDTIGAWLHLPYLIEVQGWVSLRGHSLIFINCVVLLVLGLIEVYDPYKYWPCYFRNLFTFLNGTMLVLNVLATSPQGWFSWNPTCCLPYLPDNIEGQGILTISYLTLAGFSWFLFLLSHILIRYWQEFFVNCYIEYENDLKKDEQNSLSTENDDNDDGVCYKRLINDLSSELES